VPFLHVTTRIDGRKNDDLMSKKGGPGFPTFMFLDPKGGVLAMRAGGIGLEQMGQLAEKAQKRRAGFLEVKKKAEAGDAAAMIRLDVWRLELGHIGLDEFRKSYPDFSKLDEDSRRTVMEQWGNSAFREAMAKLSSIVGRDRSKIPEGAKAAAPMLLEAARAGAVPGDDRNRMNFYWVLGTGGKELGDAEMLKLAIEGLEDDAESNANIGRLVDEWKAKLEELAEAEKGM